jgi:hypothetical protein
VRRVLKPGGRFYFEWVTNASLRLAYPLTTERFGRMKAPDAKQLMQELAMQGIIVGRSFVCPKVAALSGFVGDVVGVGRAAESTKGSP